VAGVGSAARFDASAVVGAYPETLPELVLLAPWGATIVNTQYLATEWPQRVFGSLIEGWK